MGSQRSAHQRGLGVKHRQQRALLMRRLREGDPCWWCGLPMHKAGVPLEADHTLPRSQGGTIADRLLHARCNRERGDGSRDHQRPALATQRRDGGCPRNSLDWGC